MTDRTPTPDPLILTLAMDPDTFARFDALRRRHFPQALNHIPAHATLFHHLPGPTEPGIVETLSAMTRTQAPPEVAVTGLRFIGRGVAFVLASDALSAFRARLADAFETYDEALYAAYEETTPFDLYDEDEDDEPDDDEDDELRDELGDVEDVDEDDLAVADDFDDHVDDELEERLGSS